MLCVCVEGNIYEIPKSMRCKNKEKYASKKTITQDNIYVVWQFAYVYEVARISLFTRNNTKCGSTVFLSKKTTQNHNLQNNSFSLMRIGFTKG